MPTLPVRPSAITSLLLLITCALVAQTAESQTLQPVSRLLQRRMAAPSGWSEIIVQASSPEGLAELDAAVTALGGVLGRALPVIDGRVVALPDSGIATLAVHPRVRFLAPDRAAASAMERTAAVVRATEVRQQLGYTGAGIGVAIVDSGVALHDDLTASGGSSRVVQFFDLVGKKRTPYDDYGHGTHVAGALAGNGFDSNGARAGVAPAASLVVLKVLGADGRGRISDVIAAFDIILRERNRFNIRIVNVSIAAAVQDSFEDDPLTRAARRLVEAGMVVVASAGNNGRSTSGVTQYGGVAAPANAPWVLAVGASSHAGTIDRSDDVLARFSARGPTAVDRAAKPDIVAPGVGIESLSAQDSTLYQRRAEYLLRGTVPAPEYPYLSLSGTSMAAPVVAGAVALMLQANPDLTPNAVKAILQYTAKHSLVYSALSEGAGLLNVAGAVKLARAFATAETIDDPSWSHRIHWGNRLVAAKPLPRISNAWLLTTVWGAERTRTYQDVEWPDLQQRPNLVWGLACGGSPCATSWTTDMARTARLTSDGVETVLAGKAPASAVEWGLMDTETVVWSTDDTVVWGTNDSDTVVWGTSDNDTVVWGTTCTSGCEPNVWGQP